MRRGLKRIEVGIAIGCTVVLLSLLTPGLLYLREQQRTTQCADNLRRLGILFHEHAAADPEGRLCTGAPDFQRDGCPDDHSWIGNVLPHLAGHHATLHCPCSTLAGMHHLNQLLTASAPGPDAEPTEARFDSGLCNTSDGILSTEPLSPSRIDLVANFVESGYNTTYSASWQFVRTEPLFIGKRFGCGPYKQEYCLTIGADLESLEFTVGPLSRRYVTRADFPAGTIPLIGDGSPSGQQLEAELPTRPEGEDIGRSFGVGPSFWDPTCRCTRPIGVVGDSLDAKGLFPGNYPTTGLVVDHATISTYRALRPLQPGSPRRFIANDTRNWAATHGKRANVLTADGSVVRLEDLDGDGLFNPGFPVTSATPEQSPAPEFRGNTTEVAIFDVFNGPFLRAPAFTTPAVGE